MPRPTRIIDRNEVSDVIDRICEDPAFIFSVVCERRTDLHLRYPPVDQLTNGPLCYVGEASRIIDRERVRFCDCGGENYAAGLNRWVEIPANARKCKHCGTKRADCKIVLEAAGTLRKMTVKGKNNDNATKHWVKTEGGELKYNPADHDLKLVAGMYNDQEKNGRIGRHGQWRPWAQICLRTVQVIEAWGQKILVRGNLNPA